MIEDLLRELGEKGIQLSHKDGKLKYIGPEQHITPEILNQLKENKVRLINYLSDSEKRDIIPQNIDELQNYLKKNGYACKIRNARLRFEAQDKEINNDVLQIINKYYKHLYHLYWPLPNANLSPIQPEGDKEPFFIVHGEQATPFLLETFGREIPLFDYFHQSCDGTIMKYHTVEQVSEMYLQQLLQIKTEGNFYLGGYSFGGLVAYEMACRLKRMGKNVKLLVLIDTSVPKFKDYTYKFNSLKYKVLRNIINPFRDGIRTLYLRIYCKYIFITGKKLPPHLRTFYIVDNYERNAPKYRPGQFDGKLNLIAVENKTFVSNDKFLGWEKYVQGEIEVKNLQGTHRDIILNPQKARMMSEYIKEIILKTT